MPAASAPRISSNLLSLLCSKYDVTGVWRSKWDDRIAARRVSSAAITAAGGRVETVQKMDKKSFVRVADKKHNAGFTTRPTSCAAMTRSTRPCASSTTPWVAKP